MYNIVHLQIYIHALFCLTCVKVPIIHVSCLGISQYIRFHAPFSGLLGHILYKAKPPLEPNHRLVHTDFLREGVTVLKLGKERLQKRTQLVEWIMPHFPLLLVETAVVEVEEAQDEAEPISLHDL